MIQFLVPLGPDDLQVAGIGKPWAFGMADRVRFAELDALNHVNNVVYLRWYETLRVHYMKHHNLYQLAGPDPRFVVKSVSVDYHAEVKEHASYINVCRTSSFRNTSFVMDYGTYVDGHLTTTGKAVAVLLNQDNSKRPLTEAMRQLFIANDHAEQL